MFAVFTWLKAWELKWLSQILPVNPLINQIFSVLIEMFEQKKENLFLCYCELYNCMEQG